MPRFSKLFNQHLPDEFERQLRNKDYLGDSAAYQYWSGQQAPGHGGRRCLAAVSYTCDRPERDLSRLIQLRHHQDEVTIVSQHMRLNAGECWETIVLRGDTEHVMTCAEAVLKQDGIVHRNVCLSILAATPTP